MTLLSHVTSEAEISTTEITAPERVINEWSVPVCAILLLTLNHWAVWIPTQTSHSRPGQPRTQFWNEKINLNSLSFFSLLIPKKSLETWPQRRVEAQKLEARHCRQNQEDKLLDFGGWKYHVVPGRWYLSPLLWESLQLTLEKARWSIPEVPGASCAEEGCFAQEHANTRCYNNF